MQAVPNSLRAHGWRSFKGLAVPLTLLSFIVTPPGVPVLAQGAGCAPSSPVSAAYEVTICITSPADGSVLVGDESVTAAVDVTGANLGVQKILSYLGGEYLLVDYASVYTFIPPTAKFVDGTRPLQATAVMRSYLRFAIQRMSGTVRRATLRMFANSNSSTGYEVAPIADNSWKESSITNSNAPTFNNAIARSGSFGAAVWTSVDITPLVGGNSPFSIVLTTTRSTGFNLASRESGIMTELVIETLS